MHDLRLSNQRGAVELSLASGVHHDDRTCAPTMPMTMATAIRRIPSFNAMDAIRAERHVGRAGWLHTAKFGPTHHSQRWRRAT